MFSPFFFLYFSCEWMCPLARSLPRPPASFCFGIRRGNVAFRKNGCVREVTRLAPRERVAPWRSHFKEGFSPSHSSLIIISPPPPSFKCQVCFSLGKLAKHYKFTLKESIPTAGRVRECLHTSVKQTTFFSSVSLSSFYPSFFKEKKRRYLATNYESSSPTGGGRE